MRRLVDAWYRAALTPLTASLAPLAGVFAVVAAVRRQLYRRGLLAAQRVPVPVVVVGNITVGGAGKTPLVRALVEALRVRGHRPGIVSRGHGGRVAGPHVVQPGDEAEDVGDEPMLLAAGSAPVVVGRDRPAAARCLLAAHPDVDVIVADDGLQHYALSRDVEIVVVDATRGLGNGWLLPAGPLREPAARLRQVDALVLNGADATAHLPHEADRPIARTVTAVPRFAMHLVPLPWQPLAPGAPVPDLAALPRGSVHAIAGIAHPARFFELLRRLGIDAVTHAFADHHRYGASDLALPDARAILMTEKDAVKCRCIADGRMFWLPVRAEVDPALVALIEDRMHGSQAA